MQVGDPFVRHLTYCLEVLAGRFAGEFDERGRWSSQEPAVVDEALQQRTVEELLRWKDLVKKYSQVTRKLDSREMFVIALALQRFPGPVLELGTYRGVTTCLMCEILNTLKRRDLLYTVDPFLEGGGDPAQGEQYIKALRQFRSQKPLQRVVPIIGDAAQLHHLFWGLRPSVILLDNDPTESGVAADLRVLDLLPYPALCLVHDANKPEVLRPVLQARLQGAYAFANFHTGTGAEQGLVGLIRL